VRQINLFFLSLYSFIIKHLDILVEKGLIYFLLAFKSRIFFLLINYIKRETSNFVFTFFFPNSKYLGLFGLGCRKGGGGVRLLEKFPS